MTTNEGGDERSPSGAPIYRHGPRKKPFEPAIMADPEAIEKIEAHIETYLGKIDTVFHEIVSDLVHIDVHHVPPSSRHPFHVFITTGMSDRPMKVPDGMEDHRFSELLTVLPPDWPIPADSSMIPWKDERAYWPIHGLKVLALFPHEHDTWLGYGHTIPNGDPAEPLAPGLPFTGFVLLPPVGIPREFIELRVREDKLIRFFAIIPVMTDELNLKLERGVDALTDLFDRRGVNERIDPDRKSVVRRRWFGF